MIDQKIIAECYQPLFDLMSNEHGLTLLVSDMNEIINAVEEVKESLHKEFATCDVEECYEDISCGGSCWKETGYWSICYKHSSSFREGHPQPKMKQRSIEREISRLENGQLPNNYYY